MEPLNKLLCNCPKNFAFKGNSSQTTYFLNINVVLIYINSSDISYTSIVESRSITLALDMVGTDIPFVQYD